MSSITYPAGVPCWIDTHQPDPVAAEAFYGPLLHWTFDEPAPTPHGSHRTARRAGRTVAGINQVPPGFPAAVWTTYVAVDSVDETIVQAKTAGAGRILAPAGHGDGGRSAILTDPAGVAFGLRETGAECVNEPGAWTMSSLHAPDVSPTFYEAVFGWHLETVPGAPIAFWRLPGYVGGTPGQAMPRDVVAVASPTPSGDTTPPHWSVALRVADVDDTAEHAARLGGTVLVEPVDTPGFRSAAIADPQGGVVALTAPTDCLDEERPFA
jgi:predicted enzyme related to lactoylglutathione lyase